MKVLIVEDEINAAERLQSILSKMDEEIKILGFCESVKTTIQWLKSNGIPDLIFLDIQLADGISFEIFKEVEVNCPIIFVTAFNEYSIEAFKVYSIDYILKPYTFDQVNSAIKKYYNMTSFNQVVVNNKLLEKLSESFAPNYKSRFYVKKSNTICSIFTDEIMLFSYDYNATTLLSNEQQKFVLNYSLDALEKKLDPALFFRINRNFLIHINSIDKMNISHKSRITILLKNNEEEIVSRGKTKDFKLWLDM